MAVSKTISTDSIHNLGAHRASFRPQVVMSYTRWMSVSPLGTQKKLARLITVPLVMFRQCCNFSIFFLTMSHSNSSKVISCFLVNHTIFPFTNSSHLSLHLRLMYLGHLQNIILDPSSQSQNEDFPTQIRASTPAERSLFISDYLQSLSLSTGKS